MRTRQPRAESLFYAYEKNWTIISNKIFLDLVHSIWYETHISTELEIQELVEVLKELQLRSCVGANLPNHCNMSEVFVLQHWQ